MLTNQKGFTLIEIIAVLIILGIMAAFAAPRFIDLSDNAELKVLEMAAIELNARESLAFANGKLSDEDLVNRDFDLDGGFELHNKPRGINRLLGAKRVKYRWRGGIATFKCTNYATINKAIKRNKTQQVKHWALLSYED